MTLLLGEVPAGVWADTVSRKWSLVIAHLFMGAGMLLTGLVTGFPLLVATQVLWGLGWAFSSGADVAWITDELDRPHRIASVLVARGRWDLLGGRRGCSRSVRSDGRSTLRRRSSPPGRS
jgi:MFS family permease